MLRLEQVLREAAIETVPFDVDQARAASDAWRAFGKGRHPAVLNLGDCYTYALARERAGRCSASATTSPRTDVGTVP